MPRPQAWVHAAAGFILDTPPLYSVTFAVIAGDALGNLHLFLPLWVAGVTTAIAATLFLVRLPAAGTAAAMLAIFAAATTPVHALLEPPRTPASLTRFADDSTVTLEGSIVRAPEHVEGGRTYLYVSAERAGSIPALTTATGIVRITMIDAPHFRIGDEIRVTSRLRFPRNDGNPGEFDYRGWLMRQQVVATMFVQEREHGAPAIVTIGHRATFPSEQIEAVRERIGGFIDTNLPAEQSAEMRALVIGDRGGIDAVVRDKFALTGMAHVLVISGLHLGFVAAAAFMLTRLVMGFFPVLMARGYGNKAAAAAAALAVCAYASIAGHHVSTIRALVMVLAYTTAIMIDRARELVASLALAALVICLAIPGSTADIGFQLSFASVLVILLGMRRFGAWWRWHYANPLAIRDEPTIGNRIAEVVCGYVAVSFWAMIGTAPLTAFHFNQFSMVGVVANAVVVPIMGLGAVICGLAAAALSFVWLAPAREFLSVAGWLAATGTSLAGWFVRWPFAWVRTFTPTLVELALAYGLVALWLTLPIAGEDVMRILRNPDADISASTADKRGREPWRTAVLIAIGVVVAIDAGWWGHQRYFNPDLRVTFLSVGEGDAAVVRFPGSRVMLIDAGGGFRGGFDPGERIVAPFLWSQKIMHVDYLVVSHPDRDHFGGLTYIARNFSPTELWTGGTTSADESYIAMLAAAAAAGARMRECIASSPAMTIGGVQVKCLWPLAHESEVKQNNASMALKLTMGATSILFTGDLEAKGEGELVATGADLRATILKVPHHGSATSSTEGLIEAVHPQLAVISDGYMNRFHFPAPAVLGRYEKDGATVLRTDLDGAVSAEIGATGLELRSYRGGEVRRGK